MNYKTHFIGGLGMGLMANQYLLIQEHAVFSQHIISSTVIVAGSVFGAKLLDIDHRGSTVGREHKITSYAVNSIFGHRGAIHTPFMALVLTFGFFMLSKVFLNGTPAMLADDWIMGVGIGLFSHLFLDLLNKAGIMILYPLSKKKFHLARITTGTWGESVVAMMVVAITVLVLFRQPTFHLTLSMK